MRQFAFSLLLIAICCWQSFTPPLRSQETVKTFQLIVMDPLSAPLSCDCVKGYAQRKYELLGEHLEKQLDRKVKVTWHESLTEAVKETDGRFDLVIGKHSVVRFDAAKLKGEVEPIARLTGKFGDMVQQGLIVVRKDDGAQKVSDLSGYQFFFGPEEAEEKSSVPRAFLADSGVSLSAESKTFGACSEAAVALLKLSTDTKAAAVISSYAEPLLEGCGTIKKGDLRVLAKTKDVPFITAFVPKSIGKGERGKISKALAAVATNPELLRGLESLTGFEPWRNPESNAVSEAQKQGLKDSGEKKNATAIANEASAGPAFSKSWPQFRGPTRDGTVPWLPKSLPNQGQLKKAILWEAYLPASGVGGIAATADLVIVGSRDSTDKSDLFLAFSTKDGALVWQHESQALGNLDYGNSPRATPLILGPVVYTLGAFGNLSCLDTESGIPLWEKHLVKDLKGVLPEWGYSGSPLAAGENIIVHPGGRNGMVLLDGFTGEVLKKAAGKKAAYASPTRCLSGGKEQIISIESKDIVSWDLHSGDEFWRIRPETLGDFGVPTPLVEGSNLYLTSEGNGTRRYELGEGCTISEALATNKRASPDSHTPVLVKDHLLVLDNGLWALDKQTLHRNWLLKDRALMGYGSILATDSRLLVLNNHGALVLVEFGDTEGKISGKLELSKKKTKTLAHPALVGKRLYAQIGQRLVCIELLDQ